MLEKKTVVDKIEVIRDGTVQVRFAVLILDNGQEVASKWHRSAIPPTGSVEEQMIAVNEHLIQMGYPIVEDYSSLKAIATAAHTPEIVETYKQLIEKTAQLN